MLYLSFFQMSGQYFFFYIALAYTTGVKSSVLQASSTFMTIVLAHFLLENDKLNKQKSLALLLGFSGIICANFTKGFDWHFTFMGEGFMLIAAFLSSFGNILVKKSGKSNPFFLASGQFFYRWRYPPFDWLPWFRPWFKLYPLQYRTAFYMVVLSLPPPLSSGIAYFYINLLEKSASTASLFLSWRLLSSLLIPGESFTFAILGGLLLVILGVLILNRPQKRLPLPSKDLTLNKKAIPLMKSHFT